MKKIRIFKKYKPQKQEMYQVLGKSFVWLILTLNVSYYTLKRWRIIIDISYHKTRNHAHLRIVEIQCTFLYHTHSLKINFIHGWYEISSRDMLSLIIGFGSNTLLHTNEFISRHSPKIERIEFKQTLHNFLGKQKPMIFN